MFSHFAVCCLCLCHIVLSSPKNDLGTGRIGTTKVDMSCTLSYFADFFSLTIEKEIFFKDPHSVDGCLASLKNFCNKELQINYI